MSNNSSSIADAGEEEESAAPVVDCCLLLFGDDDEEEVTGDVAMLRRLLFDLLFRTDVLDAIEDGVVEEEGKEEGLPWHNVYQVAIVVKSNMLGRLILLK